MNQQPPESIQQNQTLSNPTRWFRTLDDIDGTDLPLVGGKAFRLAQLRQHGLQVPAGLVLTTAFFEAHLQHNHLIPMWAGSPDIAVTPEALSWLADSLKTRPIAKELADALHQQLAMFDDPSATFAVRSSAIDEDQRDHTFAGVHLTELGVPRSALPIAITRCWASALNSTAVEYRLARGMSIQSIRIALLIQPMLKPVSAGVGFTANPLTGNRDELVIEATWGLGEAVVSSNVQPYFYKIANQPADYPVIEEIPGNAPTPDGHAADSGPLSADELTELTTQLAQIHALMGGAQDIEWARQDDSFFILQTRPVVLPQQSTSALDWLWTRGNYPEYLPDIPSPLFGSLLERAQSQGIAVFRELGLQVDDLGAYTKLILGRPYLNLTFLKRVISQLGVVPGNLLYTIGHTEPGGKGSQFSMDWGAAWRGRRAYWRAFWQAFNMSRAVKEFEHVVNNACNKLAGFAPDIPPANLLGQFRQQEQVYKSLFRTHRKLAIAISTATAMGSRIIAPLTPSPATFISTLALKDLHTFDTTLNQALFKLGQLAVTHEPTARYLQTTEDDFQDYEEAEALSPEFRDAFADLLATYGERAAYETDMGWPRYREDTAALLRIIRQFAQNIEVVDTGDHTPHATAIGWEQLTYRGVDRFIPWRRWLAVPFVRLLRRLLKLRDEVNLHRARAVAACRKWDLALEQDWTNKGWLAQPEDIFWLTAEEIERTLMVEENSGITLPITVQARRETFQTYAQTSMPFTVRESEIASIQLGLGFTSKDTSDVMVGLPVSPGQTRGRVVVLQNPNDYQTSDDDVILVLPSTDPSWLPLLRLAAGLIVEMGGLLSHGSVIAREYGLPAVANIPDATRRFQTGDTVLVDGSTGVVQILEPAAPVEA